MSSTAPGAVATPSVTDRATQSIWHPLTRTLLVLTFTTGIVDAVSFLGLGRVFTANMTGNVALLGFGIGGAGGLPVLAPLISLAAFLVGAACGGVLATRTARRHPAHMACALAIEILLIGIAAVVAAAVDVRPNAGSGDAMIALLALAMGVRSATARKVAVPDLTTTVLTMTMTGFAMDSPIVGGSGKGSTRRMTAVLAMLAGALAGALMVQTSLVLPLVTAAGLALVAGLTYVPIARWNPRATRERNGPGDRRGIP